MILRKPIMPTPLVMCAALLCSTAWAQTPAQGETVLVKRAAQLREGPSESSRSMMALQLQASIGRLGERQGAWIKVSAPDNTQGWVHMFDVASPASASATPGNMGTSALRGITHFSIGGRPRNRAATWQRLPWAYAGWVPRT